MGNLLQKDGKNYAMLQYINQTLKAIFDFKFKEEKHSIIYTITLYRIDFKIFSPKRL